VGSTCLISQLFETARHALGPTHTSLGAVETAIRTGHLRLLARLTLPGGSAVLTTEVASSDTVPDLAGLPEDALPALLTRLQQTGNHFRGVHPEGMLAAVRDDPWLRSRVARVKSSRPWRWRLHARDYLVWAMTFRVGNFGDVRAHHSVC